MGIIVQHSYEVHAAFTSNKNVLQSWLDSWFTDLNDTMTDNSE